MQYQNIMEAHMEIRTLRYFLAVAREENMTRAAENLHVTQPTLSKALRALEDELGKKLFTRHSFSIALTDEGMLLRDRAEDLVMMADKIEKEFLSLDDLTGGELYFGLAESWQIRHLAREIKALKAICPRLQYHITSGDTEQVTEKLDKGLLDFAVLCELPDGRKDNMYKITADVLTRVSPFRWTLRFSDLVQTQKPHAAIIVTVMGFLLCLTAHA
jgi:DNA-binding transcriptional LysR family regulator